MQFLHHIENIHLNGTLFAYNTGSKTSGNGHFDK